MSMAMTEIAVASDCATRRRGYYQRLKANSHRHATHDKTVLSASCLHRRCELDSRQLTTVADRKSEV